MKRIIALFLCLIMLCTVIPSSVFADDVGTTIGNAETVITEMAETPQEPTEPVEETVTDALVADEEPVKLNAKRSVPDAPMTEQETAEVAVETFDASVAGDGSITCYAVPNGDGTHSLYFFGTGVVANITSSNYRWLTNYQNTTTYVYIGEGITETGNNMLNGFSVLEKVDLPSTLIRLKPNSFAKCASLESVVLPDGLESIGVGSFSLCKNLHELYIPAFCTTIEDNAFTGANGILRFDVDENNVAYASADGIIYNKAKTQIIEIPYAISGIVEIPYGVAEIPKEAFKCRENLEGVIIPNSVTAIGQSAFNYAESLKTIEIPASVTTMGRQVFQHCYSLESITVDPSNTEYCSDAYGVLYTKNMQELLCFPAALQLSSYTIPSTVRHIWARAFGGNPYISGTITVPSNCEVGFGAFSGCRNLEKVVWKTAPTATEPYVHEDIRPVNQKPQSLCAACSIGAAIDTFTGLTYDKEEWQEESFRLRDLGYNAGVAPNGSYGNMARYGEDFFNYYGVDLEIVSPSMSGWKNTIIGALSEGKMVVFNANMERPQSGYDGAKTQHVMCIYGISDEGYFYVYDPSYLDAPMTQVDPELMFNCANGNTYILSSTVDTNMKAAEIETTAIATSYPADYSFVADEDEELGDTNGSSTHLGKLSDWVSYENGTASTTMRFAYTPEPTDYIYVLDYSDSMAKSTVNEDYSNMSVEKTIAYNSIEDLLDANPESRVSVVTFKGLEEATYTAFTSNASDIYDTIADENCQGFTCYADGFNAALNAMQSRTGNDANRKAVVVFVSDGDQNMWVNTNDMSYTRYHETYSASATGATEFGVDEATALREAGAEIYSVILNPVVTETAINNMAGITGDADKVYTATTIDSFAEALVDIVDSNTIRSFVLTDSIGEDFNYNGNLVAADGTAAVIDEANRTITWTLDNILPNTEYTLSFDIQSKKDSSGQFVCGDLPTNLGNAVVKEGNIVVNEVETPVLHRDPVLVDDGAQAHMIHKYTDLKRADNPALYTDGIRFVMDLNMKELQDAYEPGDKLAFGIAMLPLDKLQNGQTTNYLTMNVGAAGQLSSNGSYSFVNNTSAISSSKKLVPANMITWTEAMENCTTPTAFAQLLRAAGMSIFDVTDTGIQYSVYMMFSNASTRQAQANREIAYRGIMVSYDAQDGYAVKYSFQRNNSATRIYNHYNCLNYNVINVKGATAADMLHGESEYNPSHEVQSAAQ